MKYLKTNEGLFSKDEIPKKLIDDIKASIETKYPVTIKRTSEKTRGIFDRATFIIDTPIGNINSVITLLNPYINKEFYRATDQYLDIMKELNSLSKRVSDGYNLNLIYRFNERSLKVLIYERSKK